MTTESFSVPILIVDDRRDVLELNRILLESEGYRADGYSYAELTSETLHNNAPGVLLLDLVVGLDEPWELLRRISQDPDAAALRVVVTSDSPALVDKALQDPDLRVAAGLVMPFDIEALYSSIASAASGHSVSPLIPFTITPPKRELQITLGDLRRKRGRVIIRWVQRLAALESFRKAPHLSLAEMRGQVESLFDGIIDALELSATSPALTTGAIGFALEESRQHGRLRRHQRISAGDVAREMHALRHEILQEIMIAQKGEHALSLIEVWDLAGRLDTACGAPLFAALDEWEQEAQP